MCVQNQWAFLKVDILNGFKRSINPLGCVQNRIQIGGFRTVLGLKCVKRHPGWIRHQGPH